MPLPAAPGTEGSSFEITIKIPYLYYTPTLPSPHTTTNHE